MIGIQIAMLPSISVSSVVTQPDIITGVSQNITYSGEVAWFPQRKSSAEKWSTERFFRCSHDPIGGRAEESMLYEDCWTFDSFLGWWMFSVWDSVHFHHIAVLGHDQVGLHGVTLAGDHHWLRMVSVLVLSWRHVCVCLVDVLTVMDWIFLVQIHTHLIADCELVARLFWAFPHIFQKLILRLNSFEWLDQ